jgi:hypothetical protein
MDKCLHLKGIAKMIYKIQLGSENQFYKNTEKMDRKNLRRREVINKGMLSPELRESEGFWKTVEKLFKFYRIILLQFLKLSSAAFFCSFKRLFHFPFSI